MRRRESLIWKIACRTVKLNRPPVVEAFYLVFRAFSATNLNRRRRRLLRHSKRRYRNRFSRHLHQLPWFLKPRLTLQRSISELVPAVAFFKALWLQLLELPEVSFSFKGLKVSSATTPDRSGQRSNLE